MAVRHYTLALGAPATTLGALLAAADATDPWGGTTGKPVAQLSLQPEPSNTHVIYLGGGSQTLSAAAYGFRLEAPVSGIPPAPYIWPVDRNSNLRLADVGILGTAAEKVCITITV
jgi:hypothetical protein